MTETILALDASTVVAGWALGDGGDKPLDVGCYRYPRKDWVDRLLQFELWLVTRQNIDAMFYEIPTGNRGNMATNRKLGAVQYIVEAHCRKRRLVCVGVTASQVRATGVHKKAILKASRICGHDLIVKFGDRYAEDVADAIGVYYAGLKVLKQTELRNALE